MDASLSLRPRANPHPLTAMFLTRCALLLACVVMPLAVRAQSATPVSSLPITGPHAALYNYKGADRAARLLERAKQEGSVSVYTSLAPTEAGPLVEAFEKKTGVKVNLWRAISESVVKRAVSEAQAKRYAVDVVETNGPEMESLARENVLTDFFSPHLADLPANMIPKHGRWVPDRLNFFVVAYNTNKVKASELPKTYEGFLDPKWKGRIALEATDAEWMGAVVKTWGEVRGLDFMKKLSAMKPDMRKGHVLLAQLISSGEVEVGLTAYQANAQSFKKRGAPVDWAAVEPMVARPQGIGVARFAPHPHAALLFVDFMLSVEAQEMLNAMGRTPVSTKIKSETSGLPFVTLDSAQTLDETDKWQALWDKLFMAK
jgi:iron(III) transport system substrate-binding protein